MTSDPGVSWGPQPNDGQSTGGAPLSDDELAIERLEQATTCFRLHAAGPDGGHGPWAPVGVSAPLRRVHDFEAA